MTRLLFCSLLTVLSFQLVAQPLLDPTKPVSGVKGSSQYQQAATDWVLESVVKKNGQFKAIISGSLYSQGERLGDYQIARIDASSVLLNQGNKQIKLKLYGDDIKH
ncbi:agglutinin biogenesis protein MshK [Pseudoalteromonas pernae]|uniref:agglutinin biogenesis protein MshK n=1 Tax=Pseudoalteromonas pernae TaxID=3118054 RepID=UPI0032423918